MLKSSEPQNKIRSGSDDFWDTSLRDCTIGDDTRATRGLRSA